MMARQMYSEKSRAAVFGLVVSFLTLHVAIGDRDAPDLLPTACAVLDGISLFKFVLAFWRDDAVVAVGAGDGNAM